MNAIAATLAVRPLGEHDRERWDRFVMASPSATFFHRAGWAKVIERAFGHRAHYLYAERDGAIVGVLPLVRMKTRLFGDGLVSTPFCVYGGPAGEDAAARQALDAAATTLLRASGASYLEYRGLARERPAWPAKTELYATFRREIGGDHDANLKAIPRKQRAVVRKAISDGRLVATIDDDVDTGYDVYAESVRNLGTPVFGRAYFRELKDEFGDACEVVSVRVGGEAVASVMNFHFRDEVLPYYGGGRPAARGLGAYDFMYWEVMRRAADRGARVFDFGRSKAGTGSFAFKKNWGFEPRFLAYEYQLADGQGVPEVNPLNPKYRLFIAGWKRLPLPLANRIGPFLARGLG